MLHRLRHTTPASALSLAVSFVLTVATFASFGCTSAPTGTNTNTSSNLNSNISATANSNSVTTGTGTLTTREPANYSASMTISLQGEAGARQGSGSLQVDFAKMGTDRRWSFNLPQPVGQVTYLEKSGLKYLVLPARNQYVELKPEELGFQLGQLMSPPAIIEQLKARTQEQNLGTETVNGRTAIKYRFAGAVDTRTQAGTAQADSFVYVDQDTGLPLRSELTVTTSSGANARVVTVTENIQLSPAQSLFEVPTGMRKVTTQELKQQVQNFIDAIRVFAEIMRGQGGAPPPAPLAQPSANTNASRP